MPNIRPVLAVVFLRARAAISATKPEEERVECVNVIWVPCRRKGI
jgi:hypothetical protein